MSDALSTTPPSHPRRWINRWRNVIKTHLAGFGKDDNIVSLGRLDVRPDVAELGVRDPARCLGVVRRRLFQHLLAVQCQVLEVRITGERIAEIRHDDGCLVEETIKRTRTPNNRSSPRTDSHTAIITLRLIQ